jgi:choline dehydrogenase-like flavoprotein
MTDVRVVIGSGPSSIGVTHALLERGFEVTVLDVGETLDPETAKIVETMARQEPEDWSEHDKAVIQRIDFGANAALNPKRAFGSSYPYFLDPRIEAPAAMRLYGSHAFGGLSNVWGCALLRATPGEMSGWPSDVIEGVASAFPKVRELLRRSIGVDIFPSSLDRTHLKISASAQGILDRFRPSRESRLDISIYPTPLAIANECKACNACMYGCVYGYTYSSRSTIENVFMHNPRFRYVGGVTVERFQETPAGIEIHAVNAKSKRPEVFFAKQLFLAAGLMGTLRIVWNSSSHVARVLHAKDSSCFIIPGFLPSLRAGTNQKHHGQSHLSVDLRVPPFEEKPAHFQLYFNNPAVADGLKSRLAVLNAKPMRRLVDFANRFLVVSQGYLHSDFCHRLKMECDSGGLIRVSVEQNPATAKLIDIALSTFTQKMRKLGVLFLKTFTDTTPAGGSKMAGALPHALVADPSTTDLLGRPFGAKNVFIVDATVMASVPGRNLSLTALTNALRIGQLA